jgi:hypothetical protein
VLLVHAKHERAKAWYMQCGFEDLALGKKPED